MKNNSKRKIMIGAILILLITALTACSKENDKTEVASSEALSTEELSAEEPNTENSADTEPPVTEVAPEPANTEAPVTGNGNQQTVSEGQSKSEPTNTEKAVDGDSNYSDFYNADGSFKNRNWGTPQEYHGDPKGRGPGRIIVKGFDYGDIPGGFYWEGEYYKASNGVEVKVLNVGKYRGVVEYIVVEDGKGKDVEPNSPFIVACVEAKGSDIKYYETDFSETLPVTNYKRTDISYLDAAVVAYKNAYDKKISMINGYTAGYGNGMEELLQTNKEAQRFYEEHPELLENYYNFKPRKAGDPINMSLAIAYDGVAEYDELGAIWWEIYRRDDCWILVLHGAPASYRWDGIHQFLRYLSPDGDALYDVIYQQFYFGSDLIFDYNTWCPIGNSQIYLNKDAYSVGVVEFRFK